MNWETISSPDHEIKNIRTTIRDSEVHLTWFWSKEIDFVYIYKSSSENMKPLHELSEQDLKLYTREEYKANQGYLGRIDAIGRTAYRILPCQKRDGKLIVFNQENDDNLIYISGSKARIYFSISYKNKLFQARKKVRISIMTELPLDKELLVYVKKNGGVPVSVDDGTVYPFVREFPSGKTVPPEIEIDKNEFIRIFFNDGKKSAQSYELIPQ
ncbi:beta-mannanase [Bacillus sp. sid0103]|uniref:beta-mannanase n=1 Tax=Bacillus sp. sid0103 TaxID=2856337 RepID=UPI001C47220D|nr:beta-mannanase [Bacillus sp. sid0103]MBV7505684.1 beta-mannanase [Bacillus sp. sid0103]